MLQYRSNRHLLVLLLTLLILPESLCLGQMLKTKLAERTDFVPTSDTPLNQLIEVAQKFKIPMGIEWIEEMDVSVNESLDFREGRVNRSDRSNKQRAFSDAVVNEEGEILHIFFLHSVLKSAEFS